MQAACKIRQIRSCLSDLEQSHCLPERHGDEQADDCDGRVEDAVFGELGVFGHLAVDTVEGRQVHGVLVLHEPDVDDRVTCHPDDPGIDAEGDCDGNDESQEDVDEGGLRDDEEARRDRDERDADDECVGIARDWLMRPSSRRFSSMSSCVSCETPPSLRLVARGR